MENVKYNIAFLNPTRANLLALLSGLLKVTAIYLVAPVVYFLTIGISFAQDTIRGTTAATMPHFELLPMGIRKGAFLFYPGFTYTRSHDDNVFATESNKESSSASQFIPAISANSDWNNHALNLIASASINRNHSFPTEDTTDWNLGIDGKLDIRRDIKLFAGAGIGLEHVARSAPDDRQGIEPTEVDRDTMFTRYSQKFGRITGTISLNLLRKEFSDEEGILFGIPFTIDNSIRDRTVSRFKLRGGYQYVGNEEIFVSIEGIDRDYDEVNTFTGRDRSSTGVEGLVGASFDYHGTLLGEISLGYRSQDYDQPLPDIDTPVAEAIAQWNITDLTTLGFSLDHSIQESIQQFYSGYISTSATIYLDHELRGDILLNLSLQFIRDNYESIEPFDRDDETYYFTAGSTYKMNRNLNFVIQYLYEQRESDFDLGLISSSQFDYSRNIISFTLLAYI